MREILFRGRTIFGEWVEGDYQSFPTIGDKKCHIISVWGVFAKYDINPDTIGQYTGLTDKNGTKIFEGDILKFSYNENDKEPKFYSIEWKKDRACFGYAETADKMIEVDCLHCEVIGNIHDNPELLKVGD